MNSRLKTATKHVAPYAAIGTLAALALANPISWGMLAYGLLRIGKTAYRAAPRDAMLLNEQHDLFI
jgi:hypothetical protein